MRIWTSTDFKGHYPVGVAAVVVAETIEQAESLMTIALKEYSLIWNGHLIEFYLDRPKVRILNDGDY